MSRFKMLRKWLMLILWFIISMTAAGAPALLFIPSLTRWSAFFAGLGGGFVLTICAFMATYLFQRIMWTKSLAVLLGVLCGLAIAQLSILLGLGEVTGGGLVLAAIGYYLLPSPSMMMTHQS